MASGLQKRFLDVIQDSNWKPKSSRARKWYADLQHNVAKAKQWDSKESKRYRPAPRIGEMYSFVYSPKTATEMPYWDLFPLVLCIGVTDEGFMGLNLHYLPPEYRVELLEILYLMLTNDAMDATTRMRTSWKILQKYSVSRRISKAAIKRYRFDHIMSGQLMRIFPDEWIVASMAPMELFRKASSPQVWSDSRKIIKRH